MQETLSKPRDKEAEKTAKMPRKTGGGGGLRPAGGRQQVPLEPLAMWNLHRILRLMLLHIKYLYGIRVEVRGAHHFPPSQPYVVVSNHQSSLDLLGELPPLATPILLQPSLGSPPLEVLHPPSSGALSPCSLCRPLSLG